MELLVFLADHAGELVSRREILDAVWRQDFVSDAAVSGTIAKLRRALDDDARNPRFIETLSKRGYRLLLEPVDVLEVASRPGGSFRVGDWLVEPSVNRMTRGDDTVELDRSTMDVLLCLAERAGQPVSKHELVDRVWRTESVSDFTVGHRIAELEEALGRGTGNPGYIESVPDGGYRLAAAVALNQPVSTVTLFPAKEHDSARDPYPGLAAFTAEDAEVFFGREIETAAMWRRIAGHRLLAVTGPSGVGKSSFIRAGVIPAVPEGWRHLICTPGEAPFMSLARKLVPELAGDTEQVEQLLGFDDPDVALAVLSRWRERWTEALLVIDQFEELFTLNPPEVRSRFVDLLLRLVTAARIHVVLVMRDDFFSELHAHQPLAPVFKELTVLGPPSTADLRRALVEPARRRGFRFDDDGLPDEMVAGLEDERGALPLLAFAARRLWELRDTDERLITREAYASIGGVAGALAHHAEATLEEIGPERLPLVRELLRNLVTARATRATRSVDDLLSVFTRDDRSGAAEVLQKLVDARLLTSFEEASGDQLESEKSRRVEIVHESLLREWPRLVGWQTQDADAARLRDQLRQAAQLWEARGRPTELLWTGSPFREFTVWRESYPGGLSSTEGAFAEAMDKNARRRRRRRRLAAAVVLLASVTTAAVMSALWWRSEQHARRLETRRLNEYARQVMGQNPTLSLPYALASLEIMDTSEARRLALQAIHGSPIPMVIGPAQLSGLADGVDFSPDGQWLSVGHYQGHLELWSASGGPPIVRQPYAGGARGYFTPDAKKLLSFALGDPRLFFWSVPELLELGAQTLTTPIRHDIDVRYANIYSDLRRFLSDPSADGGWRWDPQPWALVNEIASDRLPAVTLTPDGSGLVVARGAELVRYSIENPEADAADLGSVVSEVEYVTSHPEGDRLATAHTEGTIRLWSIRGGDVELLRQWTGAGEGACNQLRFDPSGTRLAATYDAQYTILRNIDDPPASDPLRLASGGTGGYRGAEAAFHPGGRWVATAGFTAVDVFPADRRRYPVVLRGHSGHVERLAFTPDSSSLVSYGMDGTVRMWPLSATVGAQPRILHDWGHPVEAIVGWMAMSPDGTFVVTTGGEDTVRIVPIDGGPGRTLEGNGQRVLRAAVGPNGRLVAAPGRVGDRLAIRVFDLETGAVTEVDVKAGGSTVWDWFANVDFTSDGRLFVAVDDQLFTLDPETGDRTVLVEGVGMFALDRKKTVVLSDRRFEWNTGGINVHDLAAGTTNSLANRGSWTIGLALDSSGSLAVTGHHSGIIKVGPVTGEEPHWIVGPRSSVEAVAVSPDGKTIASGYRDGAIRLWPVPDLSKPPLHSLPRGKFIALLESLTNLRVVRDPEDPTSYSVTAGPFPGWNTVPEW
jgi:DNA-binding winged helix-turn-helix (wHTH) protein/WD40 repeat protein